MHAAANRNKTAEGVAALLGERFLLETSCYSLTVHALRSLAGVSLSLHELRDVPSNGIWYCFRRLACAAVRKVRCARSCRAFDQYAYRIRTIELCL